jgi:hypothetical protein
MQHSSVRARAKFSTVSTVEHIIPQSASHSRCLTTKKKENDSPPALDLELTSQPLTGELLTAEPFSDYAAAAVMSRARPFGDMLSHCQPTLIVTFPEIVGVVHVSSTSWPCRGASFPPGTQVQTRPCVSVTVRLFAIGMSSTVVQRQTATPARG